MGSYCGTIIIKKFVIDRNGISVFALNQCDDAGVITVFPVLGSWLLMASLLLSVKEREGSAAMLLLT